MQQHHGYPPGEEKGSEEEEEEGQQVSVFSMVSDFRAILIQHDDLGSQHETTYPEGKESEDPAQFISISIKHMRVIPKEYVLVQHGSAGFHCTRITLST